MDALKYAQTCTHLHAKKTHTHANTRIAMNMQVGLLDLQRQGESQVTSFFMGLPLDTSVALPPLFHTNFHTHMHSY